MAEIEFDLSPYVNEALAKVDAMVNERLKEHFRQAFKAGWDLGYEEGCYDGEPWKKPDFEIWFAQYVERLKRDE